MGFMKLFGRKVKNPNHSVNFDYSQGYTFTPGAENFFPAKNQQDPLFRLRGAGTPCGSLNVLSPAQSIINLAVPTNGLGGIQPGGIVFQPSADASGE